MKIESNNNSLNNIGRAWVYVIEYWQLRIEKEKGNPGIRIPSYRLSIH